MRTRTLILVLCLCNTATAQQYWTTGQSVTSQGANWPTANASANAPYKIVGGGARSNYAGNGNLLTQTAPGAANQNVWIGASKDHLVADATTLTAYAIGLYDPNDDWEVGVFSQTSALDAHPAVTAVLPTGYALTGGGCTVNWRTSTNSAGNLLTASFPASLSTWQCRSKDHQVSSPATVTAYVIGIRPKKPGLALPQVQIVTQGSQVAAHPVAVVIQGSAGWVVTGGGAQATAADPQGPGQLLTADFPVLQENNAVPIGWYAASKDHMQASPGSIRAYAVMLQFPAPVTVAARDRLNLPPKDFVRDPIKVQIKEVRKYGLANAAFSGDNLTGVARWEGEDVYYFGAHSQTTATTVWSNPYAFSVYLDSSLATMSVLENGQPWQRIAIGDTPNRNAPQFALASDPNNTLALSPAQGPMLIDHGRTYALAFSEPGIRSGKPPQISSYKFVYVAPNRCRVNSFAASTMAPTPNTPFTISLNAGSSCKRVVVTTDQTSTPLLEAAEPGIGSAVSPSLSYTFRTNYPQSSKLLKFFVDAYDAAGRRDGKSIQVRTVAQTTMPTAACPGSPGTTPQQFQFCVSCPSGLSDEPYKYSISGDYCSSAAGIAEIQPQFGGCSVSSGPC